MEYIQSDKQEGCFLCQLPEENDDDKNYILYRGKGNFVIMNSYPYNPGHLLVAPYQHVASLDEMTDEIRNEHFNIVSRSVEILKEAFNPNGFNLGINLGKVAGAGVEDHVHTHIVPRWQGDTNAMPVISGVRVIPEAVAETYQKLKGRF